MDLKIGAFNSNRRMGSSFGVARVGESCTWANESLCDTCPFMLMWRDSPYLTTILLFFLGQFFSKPTHFSEFWTDKATKISIGIYPL